MTSRSNAGDSAALTSEAAGSMRPVDERPPLFDALTESMLLMSRRQQPTADKLIWWNTVPATVRGIHAHSPAGVPGVG